MPRNSQFLYAEALDAAARSATRWLDLGCGHQFVPDWVPADAIRLAASRLRVVGIDADLPSLRSHPAIPLKVAGSIEGLPFADRTFDLVSANMVLEHVAVPDRLFAEVARVLLPRGRFLLHTPNLVGYTTTLARLIPSGLRPRIAELLQGRRPEDVYPTYYRANTVRSLRALAARHDLGLERCEAVLSSAQLFRLPVLAQLENAGLRVLSATWLAPLRPCLIAVARRM